MMLKCKRETAFTNRILAHPVADAATPNAGKCAPNPTNVMNSD